MYHSCAKLYECAGTCQVVYTNILGAGKLYRLRSCAIRSSEQGMIRVEGNASCCVTKEISNNDILI